MKRFVSFLSVFGAGTLLGVLGTKSYFEKKYKTIADAEIASVKTKFGRIEASKDPGSDFDTEVQISVKEEVKDELTVVPSYVQYNVYSQNLEEDIKKAEAEAPSDDNSNVYLIDIDQYDDKIFEYDKVELEYYVDDGVLLDIEENILNPDETISIDILDAFAESLESVIYVRNNRIKTDYEIAKVFGSYAELIGEV